MSSVENLPLGDALEPADITKIIAAAEAAEPRMTALLTRILELAA